MYAACNYNHRDKNRNKSKVSNRSTRHSSGFFVVDFEYIFHSVFLLTLSM